MARPSRSNPEVTSVEAKRPKRVPLGAGRNVLTAPKRDGYRRRYINDVGDRIERAIAAGYQVVDDKGVYVGDKDAASQNVSVGTGAEVSVSQDGMRAVLMVLPEELAREDDELKMRDIDEKEAAIVNKGDEEGYYGGVKVT